MVLIMMKKNPFDVNIKTCMRVFYYCYTVLVTRKYENKNKKNREKHRKRVKA